MNLIRFDAPPTTQQDIEQAYSAFKIRAAAVVLPAVAVVALLAGVAVTATRTPFSRVALATMIWAGMTFVTPVVLGSVISRTTVAAADDRRFGWQPREGSPDPRGHTDTYDRYLADARPATSSR